MKHLRITVEGKTYDVEVELLDESPHVAPKRLTPSMHAPKTTSVARSSKAQPPASAATVSDSDITSPLAAVVVSVDVAIGDPVAKRQKVVTLEAMKMNTIVSATIEGTIEAIHVSAGDSVKEGQPLVRIG